MKALAYHLSEYGTLYNKRWLPQKKWPAITSIVPRKVCLKILYPHPSTVFLGSSKVYSNDAWTRNSPTVKTAAEPKTLL